MTYNFFRKKFLNYLTDVSTFRNVLEFSGMFLKKIIFAQVKIKKNAYSGNLCLDWKLLSIVETSDICTWNPEAALEQTVLFRII